MCVCVRIQCHLRVHLSAVLFVVCACLRAVRVCRPCTCVSAVRVSYVHIHQSCMCAVCVCCVCPAVRVHVCLGCARARTSVGHAGVRRPCACPSAVGVPWSGRGLTGPCRQLQDEERRRQQQLEEMRTREAEERARQEEQRRRQEDERVRREAEDKVLVL